MSTTNLDPSTPVLVGAGQFSERIDDAGYRRLSAVELAAAAARRALEDTGADPRVVAAAVDSAAGVRQFEISIPGMPAVLGKSDNYPRSVADRVGADPARAVLEVVGGQSPQHLVTEFASTIAAGDCHVALLFGSEAISTTRHLAGAEEKPDFTETVGGRLEDRGYGLGGLHSRYFADNGLSDTPEQYALCENARRARLKQTREEYARTMGDLFAPFTRVAAANPHSAAPTERTADELVTPSERNRPITDPYTRFVVARDQVNQGAAVLLTSVGTAEQLGIPRENWVFLHGHADLTEHRLLDRAELGSSPAAALATRHALEIAGVGADDLSTLDLYSCFPIAVSNICDALDLSPDDPRGLTLTGGLPFFGGAGNNYSMHAIAETLQRMRAQPGAFGMVGANGGMLSKYSVGIYSTTPVEWRPDRSAELQAEVDSWPAPQQERRPHGWASIETYTVKHGKDGSRTGVVVGRLEADNRRFLATATDEQTLQLLTTGEPVGSRVYARSFGHGNRVTVTRSIMDEHFPLRSNGFRDDYEHIQVRRDGHLVEITINRPESRNSLHPPANAELDEAFDAYFADPELWVAILTGAGQDAFSAGNDLSYAASGQHLWVPDNGFAGLTSRAELPKPVIAAVNGYAMGGGLEIAMACHVVVADANARFALSEVRVGLVAGAGGLVRLPRTVPDKLANDMILTGRRLDATEARDHGLVSRTTEAGAALEGARELADEILQGSPTSVRTSLRVMSETRGTADTVEAVREPSDALDDLLLTDDASEGVKAFVEKRAPQWRNR